MIYQLPALSTLPRWEGAAQVCVDIETCDPQLKELGIGVRRGGYITGVSFAVDEEGHGLPSCPAFYLPVRHEGGGNYVDHRQVFQYLRDQAARFRGDLVTMNGQYDLDYLAGENVDFRPRFHRDVQVAGALLLQPELVWKEKADGPGGYYEEKQQPMNLNAMLARAGLPGKDETELVKWAEERGLDPKADMWRAPAHVVAGYACGDVRRPLQLLARQMRELEEQGCMPVFDLESRLLPVLLRMRRRGVGINLDRVARVEEEALRREADAARVVSAHSGIPFSAEDINKAAVLERHLAADGVKCPRTPTGLPSVKAGWLAALKTPTAKAIQECRKWNKIRTTFCESIRAYQVNGRIHCTFNQLRQEKDDGSGDQKGVGFGRLSSDSPNIQQQPARDPVIGALWRSIYVPDDGGTWACADFSSQEPRWITHYAETLALDPNSGWDAHMREAAKRAAEDCRTNPDWDNHSMMAGFIYGDKYSHAAYVGGDKYAKGMRGEAKIIFLGKCYGMGGGKLCRSLGLPVIVVVRDPDAARWTVHPVETPEGQKLLAKGAHPFEMAGPEGQAILRAFDSGVPYIRGLAKSTQRVAENRGWLRTALGRRCRFPKNPVHGGPEYAWGHKALNRLIQGTSADQTKLAMILADAAGIPLQLQVHDELDLTVPTRAMAEQLSDIMVSALPCRVPTRVDIELGPSWGELKAA